MDRPVVVRDLASTAYTPTFQAMRAFTEARGAETVDEIWLTEHEPVFTQGQAGKAEHVLAAGDIEVVQSDRGGQVTYHGPGQLVAYVLFDLRRLGVGLHAFVGSIEAVMIDVLRRYGVAASGREDARGVYAGGAKIGSLGLRVRRGCSYHGLALNVDMDLEPFSRINPCGLVGMQVTQIADYVQAPSVGVVGAEIAAALAESFAFTTVRHTSCSWDRVSA